MENATAVQQAESQGTQDFSAPVKHNTDFSLGIFGSSDNFLMATQMAKAFASSTIVPKASLVPPDIFRGTLWR